MVKPTYKYEFYDKNGNPLCRRSNMSKLKISILKALCKLDKDDVRATAYDDRLQERYYDVVTIARHIYGDTVFDGDKLKVSTRNSLNHSLNALYLDGFIDSTGNRYYSSTNIFREYQRNHWRLTAEGGRVLAAAINGWLNSWMARNRYVGQSGAYPVSEVVRVPNE